MLKIVVADNILRNASVTNERYDNFRGSKNIKQFVSLVSDVKGRGSVCVSYTMCLYE